MDRTDMLIHPWDAATGPAEWQDWLTSTGRFGILAVNNLDPARAPLILLTHFTLASDELLIHLARHPGSTQRAAGRDRVGNLTAADSRDFTRGRIDATLAPVNTTDDTELQRLRTNADRAAGRTVTVTAPTLPVRGPFRPRPWSKSARCARTHSGRRRPGTEPRTAYALVRGGRLDQKRRAVKPLALPEQEPAI
jgi:hypothetical protein